DHATGLFQRSGMGEKVEELVLGRKLPVLGICVGMQMLASSSEEGVLPGLGWIDGTVKEFDVATLPHSTHLPHMGWNDVVPIKPTPLFDQLQSDARFYFLHSYYFHCADQKDALAEASYGGS